MTARYESHIRGKITADEVHIGQGVVIEEGVVITGKGEPARRVAGRFLLYWTTKRRILTPEFRLGDYSKLHAYSFVHGEKPMQIGRNCWIGGNCVLDSMED